MEKIFIQTYGCAVNFSESEQMAGILAEKGYHLADKIDDSDIVIINICTVKGNSVALKSIRKFKEEFPHKKLIISGCIMKNMIPEIRKLTDNASLLSTHNIMEIPVIVEETMNDNVVEMIAEDSVKKIGLPKKRNNPIVGIVPISSGCNNFCSYCSVRLIKGKLISYPEDDIVKEVAKAVNNGCKEIWLTSQDTAGYGLDQWSESQLPRLIESIAAVKGNFRVRVGMMNVKNALPVLDELVRVFKNDKVFKFLHLPVQSGNDEILSKMKRNYTVADFKKIIDKFRSDLKDITISTDIIAGFPSETEKQFKDSLELLKEIKPDVLNISRFVSRKGTEAAKMEQLEGGLVKDRSRFLTSVFDYIGFENNKKWKSWEGDVLIDEIGKDKTFVGRNHAYKPVILKGDLGLGDVVKARIKEITKHDLRGDLV